MSSFRTLKRRVGISDWLSCVIRGLKAQQQFEKRMAVEKVTDSAAERAVVSLGTECARMRFTVEVHSRAKRAVL